MSIPVWLVLIGGVRKWLYAIVFTLSFLTTFVSEQVVVSELEETEVGQEKVEGYYIGEGSTRIMKSSSSTSWYRALYKLGVQTWATNLIAFAAIVLGIYYHRMNIVEIKLFSIGILTQALANSVWFLFALSNRSGIIAGAFILASIILFLIRKGYRNMPQNFRAMSRVAWIVSLLLFVPFLLYRMIDISYYLSVYVLVFPFVAWIDEHWNISIREAIGYILKPA
jgi:hypothetical protein